MEKIRAEHIGKIYAGKRMEVRAIEDISLYVGENEFVSLLGPSGCGKSTLLNIMAGLESYQGNLWMGGTTCLMPQSDSMFPWRNVYRNITIPLEIGKVTIPEEDIQNLIGEFGLRGFEEAMPQELSGGMRKRAALLRTYLTGGDIMLLDEPFGALDSITRGQMCKWLMDIWQHHRKTVVFVTHDLEEAISLSDRVYVLSPRPGRILDCVTIGLPRPRYRTDPEFAILYEEIFKLL